MPGTRTIANDGGAHWSTFGYGRSAFGRPSGEGWSTFAFGHGMSAFGRPGGEGWSTFAFGYGMSAFGRPGGAGWSTFGFGCGISAFGGPGGAHARLGGVGMFHGCCKIGTRQLRYVATSSPRSSKSVDVRFHLPGLPNSAPQQ